MITVAKSRRNDDQEPKHIYISGSLQIQTLDALDPLDELEYIGLLDQLHYMKEVPRRPTKTETSKYYQISG